MMTGKYPMAPKITLSSVDVRDVAEAHVTAIEKGQDGHRYILAENRPKSFLEIANVLRTKFGKHPYRYQLPTNEAPYFVVLLMSYFDERLKFALPKYGQSFGYDNSKSIRELGITYRNTDQSLIEMADNLIDIDYIPNLKS